MPVFFFDMGFSEGEIKEKAYPRDVGESSMQKRGERGIYFFLK